ncbi:MAG: helix-turn-helix domain-containing protein [Halalkalicoccus sp.]
MGTIAEVEIPTAGFALEETLRSVPNATFELVRVVAHDQSITIPYLWAMTEDLAALRSALDEDSTVRNVELLDEYDGEYLFRMDWVYRIRVLVRILTEDHATVLNARGSSDGWFFRVLFPDRDSLSATHEFFSRSEFEVTIRAIYEMDETRHGRFGLTEDQYLTLVTALDRGYYDIPRGIDIEGLAAEFDISHQAVSERLRRAHKTFIKNALAWGREDPGEPVTRR